MRHRPDSLSQFHSTFNQIYSENALPIEQLPVTPLPPDAEALISPSQSAVKEPIETQNGVSFEQKTLQDGEEKIFQQQFTKDEHSALESTEQEEMLPLERRATSRLLSPDEPLERRTTLPLLSPDEPLERRATLRLLSSDERITIPARALRVMARVERLSTLSVQTIRNFSLLDKLGTVPVATTQGLSNKSSQRPSNLKWRLVGLFFLLTALFYLTWLVRTLNKDALWLSLPYFLVSLYTTVMISITIYNNWRRVIPQLVMLPKGREPMVAVLIPTYGEPVEMVQITLESVLSQGWPQERLLILIGDDSHRSQIQEMVEKVKQHTPLAHIRYFEPPRKGTPQRKGSAKDGNLNAMLDFVVQDYPGIAFIETRDADDLVGDANFLRYALGYLQQSPDVSYVQSIKDTLVSQGDPFGNRQSFFYRGVMQARHAANAVFPCGSGLIWRTAALRQIGGFPTWNLVEDLYSGYVAMQHGLKGAYLPIVGAVGQSSPEDIPNVYKQLGTWALDTTRLCIWKNPWFTKGLTFAQRMQFTELCMFYMFSIPLLIFACTVIISLFTGIHPFVASNLDYVLHFWLYAGAVEVLLTLLGDKTTFDAIWRAREIWFGMLFVFAKAVCLALFYGPHQKPAYKVTRKVQQTGFYFREILFQLLLFLILLAGTIDNILTQKHFLANGDLGSIFWAILYMFLLSGIISKSWFGLKKSKRSAETK